MLRAIAYVAGAIAVHGCSGLSYCEDPHLVASSSSTKPGTIRAGVALRSYDAGIAALSDGRIVCLTCSGLAVLDHGLHETQEVDALRAPIAVGPDDTIYAVATRSPSSSTSLAPLDLVALAPSGTPRWRVQLDGMGKPVSLLATAGGIYVEGQTDTAVFDAASGAQRSFPAHGLIAAGTGGVFTIDSRSFTSSLTLRHLDPMGTPLWERTWTTATPELVVYDAVATPDGGVIVVGRAEATVDFGDRKVEGPDAHLLNFVVGIDAAGASQWAFTLPVIYTVRMALTPRGDILLAGRLDASAFGPEAIDSFLAVATPAGIDHMLRIGGPADQDICGLAASPDGIAWVEVSNFGGEDEPDPVLRIGAQEFHESGWYIFGIQQ